MENVIEKEPRKVTIVFTDDREEYRVVELEADDFCLYGVEGEHTAYILTRFARNSKDQGIKLFINYDAVLAIGFSDHIKPLADLFVKQEDQEDMNKYIL